ncbi:hypothetical protein BU17DRAFT_51754 [Hysterangium stoloniferum]|nr:hypothetical protein BU17DRAFT_51754 [Hysterangium stoloniferum]
MPIPPRLTTYLRQTYPKPTIDPTWLDACLAWITDELQLPSIDSDADIDKIISNVDTQLLNSDLRDSMLPDSGLPQNICAQEKTRLHGRTLVQIQGMTEIGHSAFSLRSVHQTRVDRVDLAGLAGGGGENVNNNHEVNGEEEDEGPIPKFPRSMLRFDLSDGSQLLRAIEFRRLPELELGVTPLGYKMILKDVPIRRGIAFLEPSNVELKGYLTEELEVNREADFARGLRMRLGYAEPDPENIPTQENDRNAAAPPAPPAAVVRAARTPLREMSVEELSPSPPQRLNTEEEEFGDDLDMDDAFFQELDAAEQAALSTFQEREMQETSQPAAPTVDHSEVIVIDSDSDDKENLAPVTQRRVRPRIALPEHDEDSDVIVIE